MFEDFKQKLLLSEAQNFNVQAEEYYASGLNIMDKQLLFQNKYEPNAIFNSTVFFHWLSKLKTVPSF